MGLPRCRVSVADRAEPGMRPGGNANADRSAATYSITTSLNRKKRKALKPKNQAPNLRLDIHRLINGRRVRGSPSLVGRRPAKSVTERSRGFESHPPRHISLTL